MSGTAHAFVERAVFEYNLKQHEKALADLAKAGELGSRAAIVHIARRDDLPREGTVHQG